MQKTKNRRIRKALVFASVFVILLTAFSSVIFAQAPNLEFDVPNSSASRGFREVFVTDSDNILCIIYIDYAGSDVNTLENFTFVFSDYYYEQYYSGDDNTDFTNMYYLYEVNLCILTYRGTSVTTQTRTAVYLEDIMPSLRITESDFTTEFLSSLHIQFEYWESEIDYLENRINELEDNNLQFLAGYSQALEDTSAFESALYTIFNAPFVFVKNIIGFEIFGITLVDVLCGALLLCLGFVLLKFIGGAIPL